jgi:nucleotide-binding universal stress UspA family protein
MYGHILIPTDGSDVAQHGVDHGLALAKAVGARVTILTVTEPFPSYSGVTPGSFDLGSEIMTSFDEQQASHAQEVLAKAKAEADRLGVPASVIHVPNAHPTETIVQTAQAQGAQLIVLASHGRRGLGRLLLGSQATGVVTHSPVPVLVVR